MVFGLLLATLGSSLPSAQGAATQPATSAAYREKLEGTMVSFEMVPVPGGTIIVDGKETVVQPFSIGRTEVTWDMYDVFALGLDAKATTGPDAIARPSQPYGAPDYGWGHAGYPAISIALPAAQAFCEWLSKKSGRTYRLPTDAEWQRAADLAAGPDGAAAKATDAIAWSRANASARTHPVASKSADSHGLFDLFGNAAEWVTSGDDRSITRGGSFRDSVVGPAAQAEQDDTWNERDPQLPKSRWWLSDGPFVGFRIVAVPAK